MKLKDLLEELRSNILNDRSSRVSGSSDYLWTDTTLIRYINEAQRRFATRSLVIRDATTPEVTRLTLEAGVDTYTLHPAVIAVISAKLPGERRDLARAGHSIFAVTGSPTTNWDPSELMALSPGKPVAFSTDEQVAEAEDSTISAVSLRLHPAPSSDYDGTTVQLRVVRKPIDPLTPNNLNAEPEIPVDHHIEMLDWAAYLALRIVDHDAGNAKRAAEFAQAFEQHVQAARTMVMRKLFAPKPWGFGRGGWSWGA